MRTSARLSLALGFTFALAALGACAGGDTRDPIGPVDPGKPTPTDTASTPISGNGLPPGARLILDSRAVEVNQGMTRTLAGRVVDASGNTLSDVPVTFTSGDAALLSVSQSGLLTGVRPGAGVIEVRAGGQTVDSIGVDVFGRPEGLIEGAASLDARPFGVAVSRHGVVYVTQLDAARISITDVRSRSINGSVAVGTVPTGVTFSPDGKTAYVTNQYSGNVGIVDVATGVQVAAVDVPGDPFAVRVAPGGAKLYVSSNANVVSIVDLATRTVTKTISVAWAPNGFAVSRNEKFMYVSSAYGSEVAEISLETEKVTRRFQVDGVPQELIVSKDGTELFSANEAGWVDVIDLEAGSVAARIRLAGGGFGMALSPDEVHLYVGEPSAGVVQVVNTQSRRIIHTIEVGGRPRRIAFDYHGGRAVVANEFGGVNFVR